MKPAKRSLGRQRVVVFVLAAAGLVLAACGSAGSPPAHPAPAKARPSRAQHELRSRTYAVSLAAGKRRGGPRPHGTATIRIVGAGDQACWEVHVLNGIRQPLHMSVNRGRAATTGPVLIALGSGYHTIGCQGEVAPELLLEIEHRPRGYYLTIGDAQHPGGAVRGQL